MTRVAAVLLMLLWSVAAHAQIPGNIPAGNVIGNPTGAAAPPTTFPIFSTANTWSVLQTFSGGIQSSTVGIGGGLFNPSNVLAISGNGSASSSGSIGGPIQMLGTTVGTGTGGNTDFAVIGWTEAATNTFTNSQLTALDINHFFGGTGTGPGFRSALNIALADLNGSGLDYGSFAGFSALQTNSTAVHNNGGTSMVPRGDWFGASFLMTADGTATFLNSVQGQENDVTILSGSTAAMKMGISIINGGPGLADAVHGTNTDAAIVVAAGPNAVVGWNCGLCFGRSDGGGTHWPIDTTNGAIISDYANGGSPAAKYGIKWTDVAFSTASIAVPGFTVDGSGNLSAVGPTNGIGRAAAAGVALVVQGATSDSSAFALAIQNASAAQWLLVRNDGLIQAVGINPKTTNTFSLGSGGNVWSNVFATAYTVGATAGASCTLTTVSHLTVVNGIVTLCN